MNTKEELEYLESTNLHTAPKEHLLKLAMIASREYVSMPDSMEKEFFLGLNFMPIATRLYPDLVEEVHFIKDRGDKCWGAERTSYGSAINFHKSLAQFIASCPTDISKIGVKLLDPKSPMSPLGLDYPVLLMCNSGELVVEEWQDKVNPTYSFPTDSFPLVRELLARKLSYSEFKNRVPKYYVKNF